MNSKPVTLITGTSKGIGKFLATYYVEKGHEVIGCSRSEIDWELEGYTHFIADVSNEKDVKRIFCAIRLKYGRLDHLINNAGVASMNHVLLTPVSTVEKLLNTNVLGTFLFSREAAKLMKRNTYGRIVNFSTVAVPLKLEGEAIYAASKAAIVTLAQVMAGELAGFNITVNTIGPSPVQTDLIKSVPKEKLDLLLEKQKMKKNATFEDIVNIIDFYLKRESESITGQTIYLGGL